ncbi:MAG: hypothetical protein Q9167_000151 [Letrouitia subvulpina]
MWLDKLSGHSTPSVSPPSPHKWSYSPAPKRPSQLGPGVTARPGYGPRTSSLGLGSRPNSSTASLQSPRLPNGSSLRQQITLSDVVDPLRTLESIVGKNLSPEDAGSSDADKGSSLEKPERLELDIDFNGLSLHDFANGPLEANRERSYSFNSQTAEEYETEKDRFEDLHRSILACDDVLESVQTSLTSFQKDLGTVSAEIETLQFRSTAINKRLENRKLVENLLGPAVEEVSIAPAVIKVVSEGPIDPNWIHALEILDKRSKAVEAKMRGPQMASSVSDLKPLLDDLRNKAIERIRDFFVSQIKALRSPNVNAQIIQQQSFIKYKDLYVYLARHHSQLAEEIGQAYINTMRWYYLSNFNRYKLALDRISVFNVDKSDAIGADSIQRVPTVKASQPPHDPLLVGRRMDILRRSNQSALPSYLAEEDKQTYYLETPFIHFNVALLDNATSEYSFLMNFFSTSTAFSIISRYFSSIFAPTFALGQEFSKSLSENSEDCLGLLLCIRLNQQFAFELQRRKTPIADAYINWTNMLLWPRFQLAMDMHSESVKRLTSSVSARGPASALGLGNSGDVASKQSTAPHVLTQRFGQFLQGILTLSEDTGDDEPVGNSLARLRGEVEAFLIKVGKGFGSGKERKRERFLANNYSLVLTIIGDIGGKLAGEVREHFEALKERAGGT